MCTVSFVPLLNNRFILCSNRDESPTRETLSPSKHTINGITALFPQDALAGGTWIGTSQLDRVACIMNGGFEPYDMEQQFAKSRGLIVTEVLTTPDITEYFFTLSLDGVAPFTLIVVQFALELQLNEYIWDGNQLHQKDLPLNSTIWSSRQLYSPQVAQLREDWFSQFLAKNELSQNSLLAFHKNAGKGDLATNIVMDRVVVKTMSISSFLKDDNQIQFRYEDLASGEIVNMNL